MQDICGLDNSNGYEDSSLFWAPDIIAAGKLDARQPIANASITGRSELLYEDERGGGWEANPEGYIDSFVVANLRAT